VCCACRLCAANTQRNIETIGLLGGSLSADGSAFNINTLIIPKQKGETDRVEMLKEEEIWDIFFEVTTSCCSLHFVLVSAAVRLPKMASDRKMATCAWSLLPMQDGPQAQSLFPVGWIHTHPAFDCFLSSVDIHNQYGYQVGLSQ
jgi:STAM-binding protein